MSFHDLHKYRGDVYWITLLWCLNTNLYITDWVNEEAHQPPIHRYVRACFQLPAD